MKYENKRVLVLGAGKSGLSAKAFLEERGAEVILYDDKKLLEISEEFDLCVISPGISVNHPMVKQPLISELELGLGEKHGKVIAVTGTNGKTTVSNMIHKALKKSILCGNVGIPATAVASQLRRRTAVIEVSSFQLETSNRGFRPNIAVILNITQDHLERHGTMAEYTRCKAQIYKNQRKRDMLILNYDNDVCRNLPIMGRRVFWFSTDAKVRGIYLNGRDVVLNIKRRAKNLFTVDDVGDVNGHDIENILATALVCSLMRAGRKAILQACNCERQPHRIQHIADIRTANGTVTYYNDSKSTNIASTLAACRCFKSHVNLILGGVSKGQNFTELFEKLPLVVENIFIFGEASQEILEAHKNFYNSPLVESGVTAPAVTGCINLRDATIRATQTGSGPRVVLLSPACASFDMFKNYEDRGEQFIEIVKELLKHI